MDVTSEHFCAIMLYDFKVGLSPAESLDRLRLAFGDGAPSQSVVYDWVHNFRQGHLSLVDAARPGRPVSATSGYQEDRVRQLVTDDPRITLLELASMVNVSEGSIFEILHICLQMRKVATRWVPHYLSAEQFFSTMTMPLRTLLITPTTG